MGIRRPTFLSPFELFLVSILHTLLCLRSSLGSTSIFISNGFSIMMGSLSAKGSINKNAYWFLWYPEFNIFLTNIIHLSTSKPFHFQALLCIVNIKKSKTLLILVWLYASWIQTGFWVLFCFVFQFWKLLLSVLTCSFINCMCIITTVNHIATTLRVTLKIVCAFLKKKWNYVSHVEFKHTYTITPLCWEYASINTFYCAPNQDSLVWCNHNCLQLVFATIPFFSCLTRIIEAWSTEWKYFHSLC